MSNALLTIHHDSSSRPESGLMLFDVSDGNVPELREFNAFRKFCSERVFERYSYSGIVSSKFVNKTGMDIEQALGCIDGEADIVLYHPYPLELRLQGDFLQLAELEHPGIRGRMSSLWRLLFDDDLPVLSLPQQALYCCHCNYFAANQRFWGAYAGVIARLDELYVQGELDGFLEDRSPYNLRTDTDKMVAFFPFMFERLLTHFIFSRRQDFTTTNVSLDPGFEPVQLFSGEKALVAMLTGLFRLGGTERGPRAASMATGAYYAARRFALGAGRLRG